MVEKETENTSQQDQSKNQQQESGLLDSNNKQNIIEHEKSQMNRYYKDEQK
jgi:hypothetical protein